MMTRTWQILFLTTAALFGGVVQASDFSEFLHNVFEDHHNRPPTGAEMNYQANLYRDQGSLENYIAMVGSEDYFVTQSRRDLDAYVTQLYHTFLGRNPRPDELRYWVVQFQQPGVSRNEMVRRFCRVNRVTQLPSFLPASPIYRPPTNANEIALELDAQVRLLISLVQNEIGYSDYGRRIISEATNLATVSNQYRQIVESNATTKQQLQITVINLDVALQRLELEFYRIPSSSAHAQSVLQQLSALVGAARTAPVMLPQRPQRPILPPPPSMTPKQGYAEVVRLRDVARQYSYGLQGFQNQSTFYASLYRNVQGLLAQIETVELMMRQGQRDYQIRNAMVGVVTRAQQLNPDIARADTRIQRGWWNLQTQLNAAANATNVQDSLQVRPTTPVIIDRPAWSGLPYQPAPTAPSVRNRETIQRADELSAKIDNYVASLRPITYTNPNAGRLIGSLQNLQHAAVALRQVAASGAYGNTLQRYSDSLMEQYQRTAADVRQLVAVDSTLNSPLFYQIGELVQKLQYAAAGIRA